MKWAPWKGRWPAVPATTDSPWHRGSWTRLSPHTPTASFGSVPLGRPDPETAARVEREVTGRGLYGIGELTPPPNQAALVEPVLRAANDHAGLPVVVHGAAPTTATDVRTLADLAARYPKVPLVISQLAGSHWMLVIELARATLNLHLELSTANIVFAVRLAIHELPTRTFFGSDAPYGDPVVARTTVERVTSPGEVRDRVLGGNLAELLGPRRAGGSAP